ncbi:MAG: STAS domain-containing protein [Brumimicrobium sp.]
MSFKVENKNNYTIITSKVEKLNTLVAPELKEIVSELGNEGKNNILIDLSNTSYCNSSGLSAILSANRLCKDTNGKFVLCGLQPNVQKMIEIAQLHRVFNIKDTLLEAEKEMQ